MQARYNGARLMFRRRTRPLSSRHGNREAGPLQRGCLSLFLIVWGLGFAGGGAVMLLASDFDDPGDSPLVRILFALPFVGGGLCAIVFGMMVAMGRPILRRRSPAAAPSQHLPIPSLRGPAPLRGPATLRPSGARGCAILFLVPFTLVWIGATVWMLRESGDSGGPPLVMGIVFAVIGVGVLLATIHQGLALTNPRPEVELTVPEVPIGEPIELPWRLEGSTSRISTLKIELVGREEASYTRGTNRYTDRHEFVCETVHDSDALLATPSGVLVLRVPRAAVPSFEGSHNKIVWLLRFRAPIRLWPDVKAEILIPVGTASGAPTGGEA